MPNTNTEKPFYLNGCTFILGTEIIETGGENDFIKVKYIEPVNTYKQTSNGGSVRNHNDSKAGDIEITFMKVDRRMDKILHDKSELPPPLDEFFFQVIDPLKQVVLTATQVTVAERPERNWGKEGGEQTYKLHSPNIDFRI